jgi:hypothetical protein
MAAFRVVSTIATDARDGFIVTDLLEQARQHRRIAGTVVGHFDGRISNVVASIPRSTLRH